MKQNIYFDGISLLHIVIICDIFFISLNNEFASHKCVISLIYLHHHLKNNAFFITTNAYPFRMNVKGLAQLSIRIGQSITALNELIASSNNANRGYSVPTLRHLLYIYSIFPLNRQTATDNVHQWRVSTQFFPVLDFAIIHLSNVCGGSRSDGIVCNMASCKHTNGVNIKTHDKVSRYI